MERLTSRENALIKEYRKLCGSRKRREETGCFVLEGARLVLDALGKAPLLTAGLHLGEGTGAVASLPLWDLALAVYDHCYSFTEGGIPPYTPQC